jgi:hypothetical protein
MRSEVAGEIDRGQVRLAELVAALSLGIDLGFGQPMEHALRQCLIALRLAKRIGLDEERRAVVYYTALLAPVRALAAIIGRPRGFVSLTVLRSAERTSPTDGDLRQETTGPQTAFRTSLPRGALCWRRPE